MNFPDTLLNELEGVSGFQRESFEAAHAAASTPVSIRINPAKVQGVQDLRFISAGASPLALGRAITPVPWNAQGFYLPERPSFTFDPLFHAGAYYVQEASSMFIAEAFTQNRPREHTLRVLDLCAAPGGKSTLLQALLSPGSLLVSNEVIRSRAAILVENLTKWGAMNVVVTQSDPSDFSRLEDFFDVIVVDAPCSGSGLFRKEPDAIEEWSPNAVNLCSQRQQRILAAIYPALRKGGLLLYATCSYSPQENEAITDWLIDQFDLQSLPVALQPEWGIVETRSAGHSGYGYRFWPHRIRGEGFYLSCFMKQDGATPEFEKRTKNRLQYLTAAEASVCHDWIRRDAAARLLHHAGQVLAIPDGWDKNMLVLMDSGLHLLKAGVRAGKLVHGSFVPDHNLSLCPILCGYPVAITLNLERALQYLRIDEFILGDEAPGSGWLLVKYRGIALGWIKKMEKRFNNYYPKEWRILRQPGS